MNYKELIAKLPYDEPFLFVDSLDHLDSESAAGRFRFRAELPFYQGHFKNQPVTPGVILTECCAQIGVVCLGLYLAGQQGLVSGSFVMSSSEMEFRLPVYPGEEVRVHSRKHYFRFNKLKCGVQMFNQSDELVCTGILSGMLIREGHE